MFHRVRLSASQISDIKFEPRITAFTRILSLSVQSQRLEAIWSVDVGISQVLLCKRKANKQKENPTVQSNADSFLVKTPWPLQAGGAVFIAAA